MSDTKKPSRRDFLKGSTAAVASAALVGGLNIARSAHAMGSDQLKVALIGCGGRGKGAARNCLNVNKALDGVRVEIVAVADAFREKAEETANGLKSDANYREMVDIPNDRIFGDFDCYKQAIDCGVDMVILATPPGFRPIHYKHAIQAGKHVFMEKPCCTDAPGFRSLMETNKLADQKGLKVVVGLQRRHDPRYQETIKRIHDGALGDLMYLRAYWNGGGVWIRGREEGDTEMRYQMRNWYYFVWLCGDHICEQHVHNLDICNWAADAHPVTANGMGGRQVRKGPDVGQIYDHHFVEFTYPNNVKMYSQCRHIRNCWNDVSEHAHGTQGYSNCNGNIRGENEWRYDGPRVNPYDQEHVDLVEAIRKDLPMNDGWHAATSSFTAVFGRMANYSGQVVNWDEAVEKGPSEMPQRFAWDADPPVLPDANGSYEHAVAMPGVYKAY